MYYLLLRALSVEICEAYNRCTPRKDSITKFHHWEYTVHRSDTCFRTCLLHILENRPGNNHSHSDNTLRHKLYYHNHVAQRHSNKIHYEM